MKSKDILSLLQPIADTFKVAVTELWKIFVRQYVVKGVSEVFTSFILLAGSWVIFTQVVSPYQYWGVAPIVIAVIFIYDAIQLLGNPAYYALEDIIKKIKEQE